jgi:hypothetical protein
MNHVVATVERAQQKAREADERVFGPLKGNEDLEEGGTND